MRSAGCNFKQGGLGGFINKSRWEGDEGMRRTDGFVSRQRGEHMQRTLGGLRYDEGLLSCSDDGV